MKTNATYPKVIIHRLGAPAVTRPALFSGIRWLLLAALLFVAATSASHASPFTVRTLPAGFDKVIDRGGSAGPVMHPIAADFMGNGSLQWYQGGNVISGFPSGGNLTLPGMTLPSSPGATVAPLTAAVCDVDRDGDMDIVRINQWNGSLYEFTLQVFLNNGSGTFALGYRLDWTDNPTWNEGEHYFSIVPADFNKDGSMDLAVLATYQNWNSVPATNTELGQLYVRWNDGTGSFASATIVQPTGLSDQCRISVADYDRDGDPDLYCNLYTTYGPDPLPLQTLDVFIRSLLFTNDGTGAFASGTNFSNLRPGRLVDFNGDGWADLVGAISTISYDKTLALNDGTGSFGGLTDPSAPSNYVPLGDLSVFADFGDGVRPSVVTAEAGGVVRVNGNGATGLKGGTVASDLPAEVTGIAAADSNADGDTDIFVSLNNGTFAFLENRQIHTIHRAELSFRTGFTGITALASADFNLDGREDILAFTPAQKKLYFLYTQTTGTPDTAIFKSTQNEIPGSLTVADFDQDGRPDVAYTLPTSGSVRVARNNGDVPFSWADSAIATGLAGVSLIATGEYGTSNGRPDLFTCSSTTGQLRGLYQSGGSWLSQTIASSVSPIPQSLAVGNGTSAAGDALAYLSADASSLTLRGSHLSPAWTVFGGAGRTETVTGGPFVAKVIWVEVAGDSRTKEAVYINGNGGLSFWLPTISAAITIGSSPSPIRDIAAVDWNHDGRTDVLAATDAGLCLFHYQRATQSWGRTDLYTPNTGGGYTTLTIMDINQDGYPDCVAAHSAGYLDYLVNVPFDAAADFSAVPTTLNAPAGQTVTAMEFPITNATIPAASGSLEDLAFILNQMTVEFQAATPGPNGTWVPSPIGSGTLSNYVSKVKYSVNGVPIASTPIVGGSSQSSIQFGTSGVVAPNVISTPGAPMQVRIELEMTAAAQQTTTRFFVSINGGSSLSLALVDRSTYEFFDPLFNKLFTANHPVLVTYVPPPTALQQWRTTHFGSPNESGNTANSADYDLDGVPNLVEYITGTTPTVRESLTNGLRGLTVFAPAGPQLPAKLGLVMTNSALANPKVRVTIERSTNLTSWSSYATRLGGSEWNGTLLQVSSTSTNLLTTHLFTPPTGTRYYFRLKVEELP